MRIRTLTSVTASILALGLLTGGAAAFAASQEPTADDRGTFIDGVPAPDDNEDVAPDDEQGFFIDGMPAPLFVTPADLAKGPVTLTTGQSLVVVLDTENGGIFTGTGGTDDDAVVHFDAATVGADDDEASFNAGFSAEKVGTTKGWIAGTDGQRTTFDITVVAP